MFSPADEFDYGDVISGQLHAIVVPLTDTRRGVHMLAGSCTVEVDVPTDVGRLVARLTITHEAG